MPYQPLTQEQFGNLQQKGFTTDKIIEFEKRRKSESSPEAVKGIFGSIPTEAYQRGERNVMGNIGERPGAMAREAIRENPISALAGPLAGLSSSSERVKKAAINPVLSPTFQQESIDKFTPAGGFIKTTGKGRGGKAAMGINTILNAAVGAPGMVADVVTDPLQTLLAIATGGVSKTVAPTKAGQAVSRFANKPIQEIIPKKGYEVLGKGFKAVREVPGKIVRTVAETPPEQAKFLKETIRKEGAGSLFGGEVEKAPYLNDVLAPEAEKIYQKNLTDFTPSLQEAAEKQFKLSKTAIDTLKKKGVEYSNKLRETYNDSTDNFYRNIEMGFDMKRKVADTAYREAMNNIPKGFGGTIDVRDTVHTMDNVFKGSLGEATRGTQGNRLYQIMQELKSRMPASKGFYAGDKGNVPTPTQLIRNLRGEKLGEISGEVRLSPKQFSELRDALNNLYRENPYDRNIMKVMNQLYADGETSGLTGLQKARSLQKQAFEAEEKLHTSLIKEKKLDKFQTLSELEKRKLKEIEDYTGYKFLDDLDTLTASRELDKLGKVDKYSLADMLTKASNPKEFNTVKAQLRPYLGNDTDRIMNQVRKYSAVQYVSPKGIYPTRGGMLKGAARYGLREYYENIYPKMTVPFKTLKP
jgi:hypothetical protein